MNPPVSAAETPLEERYDEGTAKTLAAAASMLGGSDKAKLVVRYIYALGVFDGSVQMAKADRPSQRTPA